MSRPAFFRLLARIAAGQEAIPFSLLPWNPLVSLLFFVHRVKDLKEGIYLLVRNQEHLSPLRNYLRTEFLWQKPEDCPEMVHFYLLAEGDCRNSAKIISCHQNIAADGVFSLGMLARFEPVLREHGPWYYRRLHWECGLTGQMLYLEAEAAGISGTGIGCFHDDVLHQLLGLEDRTWQTLYHFTAGKALEDFRLQTIPAYHHL
jgi:nitroreductase